MKFMKRTSEPFWWALFGAGGAIAALFIPALFFLIGFAFPLGWMEPPSPEALSALVKYPLTRLFLFVLISLSLLHWAHRFRFTLYDGLQLKHLHTLIAVICYGSALAGTIFTAFILWQI